MADSKGSGLSAAATAVGLFLYGWIGSTSYKVSFTDFFRERLTADRTYYIRSDGSDSNNGLANTSGGAFLTLNKARDAIASLDGAGYTITVSMGTSITGGLTLSKRLVGVASIVVDAGGNTLTGAITVTAPMAVTVQNGTFLNTAGNVLTANGAGCSITVGSSVTFGASTGDQHCRAVSGGKITLGSAYTISGGADYHYFAQLAGIIENGGAAVTVSGTPAFASSFAYADMCGIISVYPGSFTGAATGKRYTTTTGGIIKTFGSGTSYLPGDVAGTGTNFGTSPYGLYS